jgi:membrane protease YdiL (CAAX protease family)
VIERPPQGRRPIAIALGAIVAWNIIQLPFLLPIEKLFTRDKAGSAQAARDALVQDLNYLATTAVLSGISCIAVFFVATRLIGWTPHGAGLRRVPAFWRAAGWTSLGFAGYWVLTALWTVIVGLPEEDHVILEAMDGTRPAASVLFVALGACVVVPIGEELLFRGLLFRSLLRFGVVPAALISGAIFGVLHAGASPAETLVPLSILGAAFGVIFWLNASIIPCIAAHMFVNSLAIGVGAGTTDAEKGRWIIGLLSASWAILWIVTRFVPRTHRQAEPSDAIATPRVIDG